MQPHSQTDAAADDFPLLVDAAAVLGLGAGDNVQGQPFAVVPRQLILPGQLAYLPEDMMFEFHNPFIVCDHREASFRAVLFSRALRRAMNSDTALYHGPGKKKRKNRLTKWKEMVK
jgi:hypothetical protein